MKKLLIIGASVLQLPAIKRAKQMGLLVAVADYNPNAIGIPYADKFYEVSTIDIEGVLKAAQDFGADGIMTLASDMPMRSVAYAAQKLGLNAVSYETAVKTTDKGEMIKAFKEFGVPSPWFYIAETKEKLQEIKEKIEYPCILKPLDNSGSRGVVLVENEEMLLKSFDYSAENSRGAGVIIEEYMQGSEVSVEIIVYGGEINILAITDKLTTGEPHFVEMGHSQQSALPETVKNQIKEVAKRAVEAVGIKNGPAHVEIMVTSKGPKMIELGARLGGDNITTHLVPLSTGVDMVECCIKIALGEEPDLSIKYNKASAIRYMEAGVGTITDIIGLDKARAVEGVFEVSMVHGIGEESVEVKNSVERLGFVIAQNETPEKAIESCQKALAYINIIVK